MEKRLRIYVENSVISAYYFAPRSMAIATRRFFERAAKEEYELFTSEVTIAELEKAREEIREKSLRIIQMFKVKVVSRPIEARDLADKYVKRGKMVRIINGELGYPAPEIIRPDEV